MDPGSTATKKPEMVKLLWTNKDGSKQITLTTQEVLDKYMALYGQNLNHRIIKP